MTIFLCVYGQYKYLIMYSDYCEYMTIPLKTLSNNMYNKYAILYILIFRRRVSVCKIRFVLIAKMK
jgi:hypothetical protein